VREKEITRCEEQFAKQISKIKYQQAELEHELRDKERNIDANQENINQLQTEYNLVKTQVQSSNERRGLKFKLGRKNKELESDKTEYKMFLECILRNEELLKHNLTTMSTQKRFERFCGSSR